MDEETIRDLYDDSFRKHEQELNHLLTDTLLLTASGIATESNKDDVCNISEDQYSPIIRQQRDIINDFNLVVFGLASTKDTNNKTQNIDM